MAGNRVADHLSLPAFNSMPVARICCPQNTRVRFPHGNYSRALVILSAAKELVSSS
jgi:hypothetical protein